MALQHIDSEQFVYKRQIAINICVPCVKDNIYYAIDSGLRHLEWSEISACNEAGLRQINHTTTG